jgi:hypothetical protein
MVTFITGRFSVCASGFGLPPSPTEWTPTGVYVNAQRLSPAGTPGADFPERRRVSGAARRTKPGQVRPAVGLAQVYG